MRYGQFQCLCIQKVHKQNDLLSAKRNQQRSRLRFRCWFLFAGLLQTNSFILLPPPQSTFSSQSSGLSYWNETKDVPKISQVNDIKPGWTDSYKAIGISRHTKSEDYFVRIHLIWRTLRYKGWSLGLQRCYTALRIELCYIALRLDEPRLSDTRITAKPHWSTDKDTSGSRCLIIPFATSQSLMATSQCHGGARFWNLSPIQPKSCRQQWLSSEYVSCNAAAAQFRLIMTVIAEK